MNVLFVCTGNTCRSVIAEYLFKKMAGARADKIKVESCGTAASESYRIPLIVIKLLADVGVMPVEHTSTQINKLHVKNSDVIFVMENAHKHYIETTYGAKDKIQLLGGVEEIADPIGRPDAEYAKIFVLIKKSLQRILLKGALRDEK